VSEDAPRVDPPGPTEIPADVLTPAEYGLLDALDAIVVVLAKGNPDGVRALALELASRCAVVAATPAPTKRAFHQRAIPLLHLAARCSTLAGVPCPVPIGDAAAVTAEILQFRPRPQACADDDGVDPAA
jgi:hypothetical protein